MAEQKQSYMKEAVALLRQTMPLYGLNIVVYFTLFLITIIWFVLWTALALGIAHFINIGVGIFVFFVSVVSGAWLWWLARRYILFLVKGAHIAALTEAMCGRAVPAGAGQIKYGQQIIKKYFWNMGQLWIVDTMVTGVLRRMTRRVFRLVGAIPMPPQFRKLMGIAMKIVARSVSYIDAAILSYTIRQRQENIWGSARQGVLLYAQSYKQILFSSAKLWAVGRAFYFVVFAMLLIPFVGAAALLSQSVGTLVFATGLVLAGFGARQIELGFFEPFALAYVMVTYHRETEGMEPNREWDEKLQGMSKKFRELVQKDEEFVPRGQFEAGGAQSLPPGQLGSEISQAQSTPQGSGQNG